MRRFYFNLHNGLETEDQEGVELPDLAAAREVALQSIAAIVAEHIARGGRICLSHSLEVLDEDRRPVLLLPFAELIER